MRKINLAVSVFALLLIIHSCSKKNDTNAANARTVQNFSGSYNLTALTANVLGETLNLYDSLPPCEQDNVVILKSDLTAQFVDSGKVCVPPSDSTGTWSLSKNTDTIYVAGSASFIKSWDGKTLVLNNAETVSGFPVTATSTFVKQ
jgi:hypothetical protein